MMMMMNSTLTTPYHHRIQLTGVPPAGARVQEHSLSRIQVRHIGTHTLKTLDTRYTAPCSHPQQFVKKFLFLTYYFYVVRTRNKKIMLSV